ncbi:MAG: hypothetical protein H7318_09590 [Oligoflexus sp.]|nr:hypothetical protein [Oligoflexus sp.]
MGANALKVLTPEELDRTFLKVLVEQCESAAEEARQCTASIFSLTSNYVSQPEFETLQQFYDLYFGGQNVDQKKNAINDEVDDLVVMLQAQMERGEELDAGEEDMKKKQERLSLSAIQKKLESLITLDGGIRNQILPALASMQCEDAIRQRVEHLIFGWQKIIEAGCGGNGPKDWTEIAREIAVKTSSVEETKDFYEKVLGEAAPEGSVERSTFIEF